MKSLACALGISSMLLSGITFGQEVRENPEIESYRKKYAGTPRRYSPHFDSILYTINEGVIDQFIYDFPGVKIFLSEIIRIKDNYIYDSVQHDGSDHLYKIEFPGIKVLEYSCE